ncbi:ChbG/HpnK family deacetylase [Pseudomonas sp. F1_0610]|uniref:ChbG/HpnK family deacetylase n=1 Tax=Pseudomonas sp. F1_0610 TaxID=3114284 RepID=UPI0039C00BE8
MKRVTLCADDFAQSPAISQGILQLIEQQRIHATSVMTQSPHWAALAPELKQVAQGKADIGLHFNLTHDFGQGAHSLGALLMKSFLHLLPVNQLKDEYLRQIDLFTQHYGCLPDHIDGHQHVHAFQGARQALFAAIDERWKHTEKPYLRAPDRLIKTKDSSFKEWVLKRSAAYFYAQAKAKGFTVTTHFAGIYALTPEDNFAQRMAYWLDICPDHTLMMCHPGDVLGRQDISDPIEEARAVEFNYLASDEFAAFIQEKNIVLQPFI